MVGKDTKMCVGKGGSYTFVVNEQRGGGGPLEEIGLGEENLHIVCILERTCRWSTTRSFIELKGKVG